VFKPFYFWLIDENNAGQWCGAILLWAIVRDNIAVGNGAGQYCCGQ
jgi:hypothetical protein